MITKKEICLSHGVTNNAVYAHMKRKDLGFYDALECAVNCKKARNNFVKIKDKSFLSINYQSSEFGMLNFTAIVKYVVDHENVENKNRIGK